MLQSTQMTTVHKGVKTYNSDGVFFFSFLIL